MKSGLDGNPVCSIVGYRSCTWNALSQLTSLDGADRAANQVATSATLAELAGLDEYADWLAASASSAEKAAAVVEVSSPHIDAAFVRFRERRVSTPGSSIDDLLPGDQKAEISSHQEERLECLEKQVKMLLSNESSGQLDARQVKMPLSNESNGQLNAQLKDEKGIALDGERAKSKPKLELSAGIKEKRCPGTGVESDLQRRQQLCHLGKQLQELEAERVQRKRAEENVSKLATEVRKLRTEAQKMNLNPAASELQAKEKEQTVSLIKQLKKQIAALTGELSQVEKQNAELLQTLQGHRSAERQVQLARAQLEAKDANLVRQEQLKAAAALRETEILRVSCKHATMKLQQLQELLADREHLHMAEKEKLFRLDSIEVRKFVEEEAARLNEKNKHEIEAQQERINELSRKYSQLEEEFRQALHSEGNRYQQLEDAHTRLMESSNRVQQDLKVSRAKEHRGEELVRELTALVKEQKVKLGEANKSKLERVEDLKERNRELDASLEEARRRFVSYEVIRKENVKMRAELDAKDAVLLGLKEEKRIWSEELALQGSSLAQDRGRLEARNEALTYEINSLKKEMQQDLDKLKIKSKIADDQAETVRCLKSGLVEKDKLIKEAREEVVITLSETKKKLEDAEEENERIMEKLERTLLRKEELKEQVSLLLQEKEESDKTKQRVEEMENNLLKIIEDKQRTEESLKKEKAEAETIAKDAVMKMEELDRSFRAHLETQSKNHSKIVEKTMAAKEAELALAKQKVGEVEDEMRQILQEKQKSQKEMEDKIGQLGRVLSQLQATI